MRVSLWRQVRMLGIRKGFAVWRRYSAPLPDPHPVTFTAGERPSLPGYSRKRPRRR